MNDETGRAQGAGLSSVWRYAHAKKAHVVIDADEYFQIARETMSAAREQIFMLGWDFDTRIRLEGGRRWWNRPRLSHFPARLGAYVPWLVRRRKKLKVRILFWNFGAFRFALRWRMVLDIVRWQLSPRISVRFDKAHPFGCSHHQKIMVIDDVLAACGGIDMTGARWDTPEHVPHDPRRHGPWRKYYGPWHDVAMIMEGEVANALADLGRERWALACGEILSSHPITDNSPWPDRLRADFHDVEIGIARTRSAYGTKAEVREIEQLFIEQISRAKRFVYIETQYFAARRIAEAIGRRLAEANPPEFIVLNPVTASGWLGRAAMENARTKFLRTLRSVDHAGRFHMYTPVNSGGEPIYVHSKLMIVDDEILRVGSANMNNRSMGLDSECDVFLDTARPANRHIGGAITRLRHSLLAEHCGLNRHDVPGLLTRHGSMAAMIDALPCKGRRLERFDTSENDLSASFLADDELLDPEYPPDVFEILKTCTIFGRGGILRQKR